MIAASSWHSLLADAVVIVHLAFVAFVALGLPAVWAAARAGWSLARKFWFRIAHLAAIAYVTAESVFGVDCPLTRWETELRLLAGEGVYEGSFVQHWVHRILFYEASPALFACLYALFLLSTLVTLWLVPPSWPSWLGQRPRPKSNA